MEIEEEIKQELMDTFDELSEDIEAELALLETSPENTSHLLASIFRAIHSIKGNAGMLQYQTIVNFAHAIENVADAMRADHFPPTHAVCEAIQLGMDRLRDLHQRELFNKQFENLREEEMIELFTNLAAASEVNASDRANELLRFMSKGLDIDDRESLRRSNDSKHLVSIKVDDEKLHQDLIFFQELALQIDNQSHYWQGRSIQLFDWALKLNKIGGNIVSYEQFAAAAYLHDIGMSFLPTDILQKPGVLSTEERNLMHNHPRWGYEFLNRIPGWEEAAKIILNHHERVDGKGYPNGKTSIDIHPGAKILAIIDAFFSIIHGRADRSQRSSVLRAISEINACSDTQFDGMWVQCFNHMVRTEAKQGFL